MKAVKSLYVYIDKILQHTITPLLPFLARLVFAATLLPFLSIPHGQRSEASHFRHRLGLMHKSCPRKLRR